MTAEPLRTGIKQGLAELLIAHSKSEDSFPPRGLALLTEALRRDQLDAEAYFALPLLADQLAAYGPAAEFVPIVRGLVQRGRILRELTTSLAMATSGALELQGIRHAVVGDLATARVVSAGTPHRLVSSARMVVPAGTPRSTVKQVLASVAAVTGAQHRGGRRPVLHLHGVQVSISSTSLAIFGFPSARDCLWDDAASSTGRASIGSARLPSLELVVFDSIARSSLGPPRVRWLADVLDAHRNGLILDWQRIVDIGSAHRWVTPVQNAMADLSLLGIDEPRAPQARRDAHIDLALQGIVSGQSRPRRALLLSLAAARNARYWRG